MTSISNPLAALCLEVEVSKIPNTISIQFFFISYHCLSITITILTLFEGSLCSVVSKYKD